MRSKRRRIPDEGLCRWDGDKKVKRRKPFRPAMVLLVCLLLTAVAGCAKSTTTASSSAYSPLIAAWESALAGRDLSTADGLRKAIEAPGPLFAHSPNEKQSFAYEVTEEEGAGVVMWRLVRGADPLGKESWWEHACADVQVEGAHLAPHPVGCRPGVPEEPPGEALPGETADPQGQRPWARPADGDLSSTCDPENTEVVMDQFQASGPREEARLSVRNQGTRSCDLIGTPGIRFQSETGSRVVSPGGGSGEVRLGPGQSSTSTVSWEPESAPPGSRQRVDVTLGSSEPARVQFGYGTTIDPFRLPGGTGRVSAWSSPSEVAAIGDVGAVSTTVAPTCDSQRVSAALTSAQQGYGSASAARVQAEIHVTNDSFLPCRADKISVASERAPGQMSTGEVPEQVILPGGRGAARISWEPTSAPDSRTTWTVDFGGGGDPVPLDQNKAFIPAAAQQITING